jgi:hypothetical protein
MDLDVFECVHTELLYFVILNGESRLKWYVVVVV